MSKIKMLCVAAALFCVCAGDAAGAPKKILIIPAGSFDRGVLAEIRSSVERAFGRTADIGIDIRMPSEAHDNYRRQYSAPMILTALEGYDLFPRIGQYDEYERTLVVVDADLYSPGLKYVFGEADPATGRAVMSLTRLAEDFYNRPRNRYLLYDRAAKEAVHELGHTYGLGHCPDKKCVMYFSNSIEDTDEKNALFCANCQKKYRALMKKGTKENPVRQKWQR
jgi:archaemetzincin